MMKYFREFISHRLIVFLVCLLFANSIIVWVTPGHPLTGWAVVAGIVLFGVSEYLVHRFLLHEFPRLLPKAYLGHMAHHEHPTDARYLFGPIRYDLASYSLLYAVLLALTRNLHVTAAVALGASVCQLYYQWKHFVSHRPIVPLTPWGKWMKKLHLLHHYKDANRWYGVSHPMLDILMGTYADIRRKPARHWPSGQMADSRRQSAAADMTARSGDQQ